MIVAELVPEHLQGDRNPVFGLPGVLNLALWRTARPHPVVVRHEQTGGVRS